MALGDNIKKDKLIPEGENEKKPTQRTRRTSSKSSQQPTAKQVGATKSAKPTQTNKNAMSNQITNNELKSAIDAGWAFIEFTPDGNIIDANENFLKTLEYSDLSEIKGQHHRIFCESRYSNSSEYENFWSLLNQGVTQSGEFMRRTKQGNDVWINASYSPIKNANGKVVKVIKIAADITKAKSNQQQAESLKAAVDAGWAQIEFEPDGTIIDANSNFCQGLGYELNEIVGRHHRIFCKHDYAASTEYSSFWRELANNQIKSGDFERIQKSGESIWIKASYTPVTNERGEVIKVIKIATDITQAVLNDQLAKKQAEANEQTLEQAVDGVVTINQDKEIIFFNKAAERMWGFSREEVLGKNIKEIVPMEHRSRHDGYVEANMNTGVNKIVGTGRDVEVERKDGSKFWANLAIAKVEIDGNLQYTAFAKDVNTTKHNNFGFEEATKFINELAQGNFDAEMKVEGLEFDDGVAQVVDDLRGLRNTIREITAEVNHVVNQAGVEGDLTARLNLSDAKGSWQELVGSLNMMVEGIASPVMQISTILENMAKGDLTQSFDNEAKGDIKKMGDSLNAALENLNDLLGTIEDSSTIVANSSKGMLDRSEAMKRSAGEVASAITQMSKGAQDQAIKTDESSKLVEEVMRTANEMASKAAVINTAAERGQDSCNNGLKIIKNLVENMTEIQDSATKTSGSIGVLTNRAEEIARTLNVITDIAAQTNLLALNAAIEAARAGDAGRGFAVVAEEIRKLAEDSRKSAVGIEQIINDVQKDTQAAGKAIDTMEESVKQGNSASKEAETIFLEIADSSKETLDYSLEINKSTGDQKNSIDSVVKNIEQIVVVAEETAAGTEQVATSSRELDNGMTEVTETSNSLSQIAEELKAGVNQFRLKR